MKIKKNIKRGFGLTLVLVMGVSIFSNYIMSHNQDEVYSSLKEKYGIVQSADDSDQVEVTDEGENEVVTETEVKETAKTLTKVEAQSEYRYVKGKKVDVRVEVLLWNTLREHGYSEIQTAAVIGNLIHESDGLKTNAVEDGNNHEGYGLVQWSYGRKEKLFNYCESKGKAHSDLQCQIEYLMIELDSREFYEPHRSTFKNPYSINEASEAYEKGFERCAAGSTQIRKDYSWDVYYTYHAE